MNGITLKFRQYQLKFKTPFRLHNRSYQYREGFIVRLTDPSGLSGFGEAAPLPGFSQEHQETVKNELAVLRQDFATGHLSLQPDNELKILTEREEFSPSVRFGTLTAYHDLLAKKEQTRLSAHITSNAADKITVNALIGLIPVEEAIQKATEFIHHGYRILKVKLGRPDVEEDFRLLQAITELTGNTIPLRPDVNQAWTFEEAKEYLARLAAFNFNIDYIEQPIPSSEIDSLKKLNQVSPVPLAADESLNFVENLEDLIKEQSIPVLIWKPSVYGTKIFREKIQEALQRNDIRVIVSSGFESLIGTAGLCHYAAACFPAEVHGLGTADIFEKNVIDSDGYNAENGTIRLPENPGIGFANITMDEIK